MAKETSIRKLVETLFSEQLRGNSCSGDRKNLRQRREGKSLPQLSASQLIGTGNRLSRDIYVLGLHVARLL